MAAMRFASNRDLISVRQPGLVSMPFGSGEEFDWRKQEGLDPLGPAPK